MEIKKPAESNPAGFFYEYILLMLFFFSSQHGHKLEMIKKFLF